MANFFENLRSAYPQLQNNAPLANAFRTTIPKKNTATPSQEEINRWEGWRQEQADKQSQEQAKVRQMAANGSISSKADNNSLAAALNGTYETTDDVRHYVDRGVFENIDTLSNMADEYENIATYADGENVLRKYYFQIKNKTPKMEQMFSHFAYGNKILQDTQDAGEDPGDPKDVADYMRYIFSAAKSKYGSRKT